MDECINSDIYYLACCIGFHWSDPICCLWTNPSCVRAMVLLWLNLPIAGLLPRFLDVADAKGMTIPHICLVSPDEPADILKPYEEALPPHSEFELYGTMFHGWMGARANLESEENVREFN